MRAVRLVFDTQLHLQDPRIQSALKALSWDFRGIIGVLETGDLLLMCECITLPDQLVPPPGISIAGITIEKHLESWTDKSLKHTIVVLRFSNELLGKYFTSHNLTIMSGTNLTPKGLVIQLCGNRNSMMSFVNDVKEVLPILSITSAKGGKGIVSEALNPDESKVLKNAFINGWYDAPKGTSIRQLAKLSGVSKSSVSNYLSSAERKIIREFIDPE